MLSKFQVDAQEGDLKLNFYLSGSLVFEREADCVPPVDSRVTFVMQTYKKGMDAGTLVTARVTDDIPPRYEFLEDEIVVHLDVDGFEIHGED